MNPTQKRYAVRLQELIDESEKIEALVITPRGTIVNGMEMGGTPFIKEKELLTAWLIKIESIIETVFGNKSPHYKRFQQFTENNIHTKQQINSIKGLLIGSLDDLESGFLIGQEFLIAGEVFDSLLEEAKYLFKYGHDQAAAILGRVVLEDALKRLARLEQINDKQKASQINIELRKVGRYNLPQERFIQGWLDIGNHAAHGEFDKYTNDQVKDQIDSIDRFIAIEFNV